MHKINHIFDLYSSLCGTLFVHHFSLEFSLYPPECRCRWLQVVLLAGYCTITAGNRYSPNGHGWILRKWYWMGPWVYRIMLMYFNSCVQHVFIQHQCICIDANVNDKSRFHTSYKVRTSPTQLEHRILLGHLALSVRGLCILVLTVFRFHHADFHSETIWK